MRGLIDAPIGRAGGGRVDQISNCR
jgi:hypothetical protein